VSRAEDRPVISDEGGVAYGACIAGIECASIEDDATWNACWQSAKGQTPVTQSTRDFCKGYTERSFECAYSYSTTECEWDYRMWGDDMLDRMTICSEAPDCAVRETCAMAVFAMVFP
jgi:hypothetical protein